MKRLLFIITCFLVHTSHTNELSDAIYECNTEKVSSLLKQNKLTPITKYKYLDIANETVRRKRDILTTMELRPRMLEPRYFCWAYTPILLLVIAAFSVDPSNKHFREHRGTYFGLSIINMLVSFYLSAKEGAKLWRKSYDSVHQKYDNILKIKELIHDIIVEPLQR